MSMILAAVIASWKSRRPYSPEHVLDHYIAHPDRIGCAVAVDRNASILGFQSLKVTRRGNPYDLPQGWGVIGTYVALNDLRKGVGRALFAQMRVTALGAGLTRIDATIGARNQGALAYYDAMGFRTYRHMDGAVGKKLILPDQPTPQRN